MMVGICLTDSKQLSRISDHLNKAVFASFLSCVSPLEVKQY